MITVETTGNKVRASIPQGTVPPERLNEFLDWLHLEEIAQRSHLSREDVDQLAEETKGNWWTTNRDRFIVPNER